MSLQSSLVIMTRGIHLAGRQRCHQNVRYKRCSVQRRFTARFWSIYRSRKLLIYFHKFPRNVRRLYQFWAKTSINRCIIVDIIVISITKHRTLCHCKQVNTLTIFDSPTSRVSSTWMASSLEQHYNGMAFLLIIFHQLTIYLSLRKTSTNVILPQWWMT